MRVATIVVLVGLWSGSVQAQGSTSRRVAAETLFDSGLARMREGRYAEACAQLEQSLELDRAVGAMMYLAECYERLDRVASAWLMFREAASQARAEGQVERWHTSDQRAAVLEPKLPRVVIRVSPVNGMSGLTIKLNDELVPSTAWGVPMPVDPGESHVEARAPGYQAFSVKQQLVGNGDSAVVSIPPLIAAPNEVSAPPAAVSVSEPSAPPTAAAAPHPTDDRPSSNGWQKPLGIGTLGAGVVALGIGTYFGLHAISRNNAAEELCPSSDNICDDPQGIQYSQDATDAAHLADAFLIGGGVLAATGLVLWITAPSAHEPAASVRADGRTLAFQLTGAF